MEEAATRRDTQAAKNSKTLKEEHFLTQRTQRARREGRSAALLAEEDSTSLSLFSD